MTRVDFYLLPVSEPHGRLTFACRLVERVFTEGHHIYVHASSTEQVLQLDEMLWSFRAESFVPHHALAEGNPEDAAAVTIGCGDDPGAHHDVLINLDQRIPPFFSRFQRVAEIVLNDAEQRNASRERWRYYRDRGYALEHHDMQHLRSTGAR